MHRKTRPFLLIARSILSRDDDYAEHVRKLLDDDTSSTEKKMARILVAGAKWVTESWSRRLVQVSTRIRSGPFEGMDYCVNAAEGAYLPRLLGTYETELAPAIAALRQNPPDHVIDIGCAEGYYAVGFARIFPKARVHAHDIDEVARRRCALLAKANGVEDRLEVAGEFTGEDFAPFEGRNALVFMDAEGFEDELLHPDRYPALQGFSLIVETHPGARPGVTDRLTQRFQSTHDIQRIDQDTPKVTLPQELREASHLEMLLSLWEWRGQPTPWLFMRPKARNTLEGREPSVG